MLASADRVLSLQENTVSTVKKAGDLPHKNDLIKAYSDDPAQEVQDNEKPAIFIEKQPLDSKLPLAKPEAKPADIRRQSGDLTVWKFYFLENVGVVFTFGLLLAEITWGFISTFPSVWLKWWTDSNGEAPNQKIGPFLGGYAGFQIAATLQFGIVVYFALVLVAAKSGLKLHQVLLETVMSAPLSLFTSTDTGSITTRFSQDIGLIDRLLPLALFITLGDLFTSIAQAVLIAVSTAYVAISFPFLMVLVYCLQKGYLRTSRQIRLLDLEEKAPVFSHFIETLSGLATIRAFGWGEAATSHNQKLVDNAQKPFYLLSKHDPLVSSDDDVQKA